MAWRGNTVGANSVAYFFCAHQSIQAKKMNTALVVIMFIMEASDTNQSRSSISLQRRCMENGSDDRR